MLESIHACLTRVRESLETECALDLSHIRIIGDMVAMHGDYQCGGCEPTLYIIASRNPRYSDYIINDKINPKGLFDNACRALQTDRYFGPDSLQYYLVETPLWFRFAWRDAHPNGIASKHCH